MERSMINQRSLSYVVPETDADERKPRPSGCSDVVKTITTERKLYLGRTGGTDDADLPTEGGL